MKRSLLAIVAVIAVLAAWKGAGIFQERAAREARIREQESVVIPAPVARSSSSSVPAASVPSGPASSRPATLPPAVSRDEVNWDVPFTPQAPFANWDAVHKEACEESSVLMVLRYFEGRGLASPEEADAEIVRLVEASGAPVDETAAEVADLLRSENPSLDVSLLRDPTEEQLKAVLAEGRLVIVPAAGRQLGNPFFQNPGPPYHMLVLRGYTKDGHVITNDPGTKRGENFAYKWDVLINAIHDWNGGDVENGAKVVVVIGE